MYNVKRVSTPERQKVSVYNCSPEKSFLVHSYRRGQAGSADENVTCRSHFVIVITFPNA